MIESILPPNVFLATNDVATFSHYWYYLDKWHLSRNLNIEIRGTSINDLSYMGIVHKEFCQEACRRHVSLRENARFVSP